MRLASFQVSGKDRFGLSLDEQHIYDLSAIFAQLGPDDLRPASLLDLIEQGAAGLTALAAIQRAIQNNPAAFPYHTIESVQFLAPVTRPSKICCLALNNSANADRILSGPRHPAMFVKAANTLTGHGSQIICKPHYGRVHPEPELAVVIGKLAKDVPASQAYEHVFGYTVHNDITSPTMRGEDTFHYRAIHPKNGNDREIEYIDSWVSYPGRYKGCDTFACMGPWLVTRDEIPDPHVLAVECWQNGELMTADNTANLFYKVPEVIEFLSGYMSLLPGDIISMGTALKASAQGGGAVQNINLSKSGTRVAVMIERIGTLENTSLLLE
jgi:2-keto-4-pentenoate hydratase/2-oxohepta-3-ene-1,7-dioic acid hydratase in catechol pathway